MSNTITPRARVADSSAITPLGGAVPDITAAPRDIQPRTPDLRLVIEEDEASGRFIYVTLDRRTGEIVRRIPREEVLRLREEPDYAAGDVVDSRT